MKKMTILRSLLGAATILCATMAIGVTAEARSVSAYAGQAESPASAGCFGNSLGAIINNCSSLQTYCVALPVDSSSHTVTASVFEPDPSHWIRCMTESTNPDASFASWGGGNFSPTTSGVHQQINLGSVYVPGGGGLFVCCDMEQGSRFETINW